MSWTLVIWLMSAGACIILAAVHLLVWLRDRNAQASLAFSLWTTAVAISALFELAMMHAPTREKYAVLAVMGRDTPKILLKDGTIYMNTIT